MKLDPIKNKWLTFLVSSCLGPSIVTSRHSATALAQSVDDDSMPRFVNRGVSVDQDGKSNVWAIEPKMEVSTKSSEENTRSALFAGGGVAVTALFAGVILSNLPDPSQF